MGAPGALLVEGRVGAEDAEERGRIEGADDEIAQHAGDGDLLPLSGDDGPAEAQDGGSGDAEGAGERGQGDGPPAPAEEEEAEGEVVRGLIPDEVEIEAAGIGEVGPGEGAIGKEEFCRRAERVDDRCDEAPAGLLGEAPGEPEEGEGAEGEAEAHDDVEAEMAGEPGDERGVR